MRIIEHESKTLIEKPFILKDKTGDREGEHEMMSAEGKVTVDKIDWYETDDTKHPKGCMCPECKEKRSSKKYLSYTTDLNDECLLYEIKEKVHKNRKKLKEIDDNIEDIKECLESEEHHKKGRDNCMNCCGSNMFGGFGGFGGYGGDWWGLFAGIMMGALFGGGWGGFGNRFGNGFMNGETMLGQNIDTAALMNALNNNQQSIGSLGKEVAEVAGNVNTNLCSVGGNLAAQMQQQTSSIKSDLFNQTLHTDGEIGQIGRTLADCCCQTQQSVGAARADILSHVDNAKYDNTVATMQSGYETKAAICASDRNTDAGFFGVSSQLCNLGKESLEQTNALQRDIFANQYATSKQLDQMSRDAAQCCCENKLMMTMGFSDLQHSMDRQFCDLKAELAADKLRNAEFQIASLKDALNQKTLADAINTTITNGLTQLGAVFNSNVIPNVQTASVR